MQLFIDTDTGGLVLSASESTRAAPPVLYAGDILPVELHFLRRTGELDPYWEHLDVSGYQSIELAIGQIGDEPVAACSTWTEVAIQVVERVKGGTGINEIQRVSIVPSPGSGTFTLTFASQTTAALACSASAATIQAALESLSSVGTGNVGVTEVAGHTWDIEFKGALAATDVGPISGDAAGLTGELGILYGSLDLSGEAVETLLGENNSVEVVVELEVEPSVSTRATIIQAKTTLRQDLIDNSA